MTLRARSRRFFDRIEELEQFVREQADRIKRRVIWSLLAFGLGAGSAWWFRTDIFHWLLEPADGQLSPFEGGLPVFIAPTDMIGATVSLAIRGGAMVAIPVVAASIYTLFRPVLPSRQRRFLIVFLPVSGLLFAGGVAFAYYVMLPVGLEFLLNFGTDVAVPLIAITSYLDLLTQMMFLLGLVFQLPLAMFLLTKMRVIKYQKFRGFRIFVPPTAFILAAIITPTIDAVNSTLVAVPIIVLYELGLFLSWLARPEDGNYLWAKSVWAGIAWVLRRPVVAYRKVTGLVVKLFRKVL